MRVKYTPRTAIVRQLYGMVFGQHPYRRPVLGTPATMNAAGPRAPVPTTVVLLLGPEAYW